MHMAVTYADPPPTGSLVGPLLRHLREQSVPACIVVLDLDPTALWYPSFAYWASTSASSRPYRHAPSSGSSPFRLLERGARATLTGPPGPGQYAPPQRSGH